MKYLVVSGTDTEIGKTIVTAAIASIARESGLDVAVVKPAQTGLEPGAPGDVDEVRRLSGVDDTHEFARYPEPLAPATAASRVGEPGLTVSEIVGSLGRITGRDLVLIEGAGGVLVRLNDSGENLIDLAAALDAPVLLVVRAGLGTLNHSALSVEAMRARGVGCAGLVIGSWPDVPDLASRANMSELPEYCGAPLLGRLPEGAAGLEPLEFQSQAQSWINSGGLL